MLARAAGYGQTGRKLFSTYPAALSSVQLPVLDSWIHRRQHHSVWLLVAADEAPAQLAVLPRLMRACVVCSSADVSSAWWEVCDDLEGPNFPIPAGFQVQATSCTCLHRTLFDVQYQASLYCICQTVHLFLHNCRTGSHQASHENFLVMTKAPSQIAPQVWQIRLYQRLSQWSKTACSCESVP